jgi:hypothetical protein
MFQFFKRLFCKHNYKWYYKTIGNDILHENRWYYDDYEVGVCTKCKDQIRN